MKILKKIKRKKRIKRRKSPIYKPAASKYIILTFKTFLTILIFMCLVGLLIFIFKSDYFRITSVSCQKSGMLCSQKEEAMFLDLRQANIFVFDRKKMIKTILRDYPGIRRVEIKKVLPDKVFVNLEERKQFAAIKGDNTWFIIDDTGFILEAAGQKPAGLAEIKGMEKTKDIKPGEKVETRELDFALSVLRALDASFIILERIQLEEGLITLFLAEDITASLSAEKGAIRQVDSLQFILRQSKIDGNLPTFVDLRFEKPVVKF